MELFVKVMFGFYILAVLISISQIAQDQYPRARKPATIGLDLAGLLIQLGFTLWAAWLLFGQR